jgi:hypothetical protein
MARTWENSNTATTIPTTGIIGVIDRVDIQSPIPSCSSLKLLLLATSSIPPGGIVSIRDVA